MGNTYPDGRKDEGNEGDTIYNSKKSHNMSEYKGWTLIQGGKPGRTLIFKLTQSEICESWFQELFSKPSHGLGKIPKQIMSLEEKYLKRCLELIHVNTRKGAPCAISLNLSPLDMGYVSDHSVFGETNSLDVKKCAIDYPMTVGTGDLAVSSVDEGIVGSIMGSYSMMRILSSPLFQRLGISDHVASLIGTNSSENNRSIPSDYQGSPDRLLLSPSWKPGKSGLRNRGHKPDSVKGSPVSESSAGSLLTDKSSAFSFSQGMLQCTWEDDIPHFAFSLDDQKDLYVANAWKAEVISEKALDYVYSFHLKSSGQKLFDFPDNESDLLGKMKVLTSYSHCSGNCEVMESEFVLVGVNDNHSRDMHTLSRNSRRSRKLSRVVEMFKHGHPMKQRTSSIFGGSSTIPEGFTGDKGLEADWNPHQEFRPELSEDDFLPNLELAAIVVKDHLEVRHHQKKEVGGWGLKFLEKAGVNPSVDSSDVSAPSERFLRNVGNCSTSMDIVVPAGPHGGPRTRDGGPSSLIQRWRSSGRCDCGGWDIGCPLKVLKARPRREEGLPYSEAQVDCKSFEMFTEGSEQGVPAMKMVNIRDGLHFISFQSSFLSPLQCFSIVVATIHSQSPRLRPKHVQK